MEEKKKLKFTALDLIIILFIVACIVGAVIKSGVIDGFTNKDDYSTIVYTVKCEYEKDYFADQAFKKGNAVFNRETGDDLGVVQSFVSSVAYGEYIDQYGDVVQYEKTGVKTAYITIAGDGLFDDYGYYVGGSTIVCPGAEVELETWLGTAKVTVVSVEVPTTAPAGEK